MFLPVAGAFEVIQRSGNCPVCGFFTPFHGSWYDPSKIVADPKWVREWDPELLDLLLDLWPSGATIEHADGDWWYHVTKTARTVEAYPLAILLTGKPPAERVGKTWRQKKVLNPQTEKVEP